MPFAADKIHLYRKEFATQTNSIFKILFLEEQVFIQYSWYADATYY